MPMQVNNTESMTGHVVVNLTVRNDITKMFINCKQFGANATQATSTNYLAKIDFCNISI